MRRRASRYVLLDLEAVAYGTAAVLLVAAIAFLAVSFTTP